MSWYPLNAICRFKLREMVTKRNFPQSIDNLYMYIFGWEISVIIVTHGPIYFCFSNVEENKNTQYWSDIENCLSLRFFFFFDFDHCNESICMATLRGKHKYGIILIVKMLMYIYIIWSKTNGKNHLITAEQRRTLLLGAKTPWESHMSRWNSPIYIPSIPAYIHKYLGS